LKGDVWSCGGGTQSAAIAALIVQEKLPKPDLSVIADTGREASETWRYFNSVMRPALAIVGVDLVRLPHSLNGDGWNTVDIYSGKGKNTIIMPMFTDKTGAVGKLPKYCSNEWKQRPVARWIRSKGFTHGRLWIGYSVDEIERMRAQTEDKWNHWYPLADLRMSRSDCISLVESMGWPTPPRSACWMCPYRTDQEWLHLKETDQADFQRAATLESELQKRDPHVYFHDSCEPLEAVSFNEEQGDLFNSPCESGMCFT